MKDCSKCCFAEWDFVEYVDPSFGKKIVCGCKQGFATPEECEDYYKTKEEMK